MSKNRLTESILTNLNESIKDNLKSVYTNRQASEQSVIDEIVSYFTDYFKSDKYVNYIEKLCEERIKSGDKSKQFNLDFWGGYNSDAYFRAPGITWEKGTGYEKREYEGIELYKINFKVMEKVEQAFNSLLKQEGLNVINEKTGYNNPSLSDWYHKEITVSLEDFLDEQITESSRYTDIEDNDPILDKEIDVYDINAFVDENINDAENNYKAYNFDNHGAAIIVTSKGNGCILDFEAVGTSFDSVSDDYKLYLASKDSKDEEGRMTIALVPTATVNVKIEDLMTAPSKKMKVRDFFYKYGYNDRCARNFDEIKHYLSECDKTLKEDTLYSDEYYVIGKDDFQTLLDKNGGAFEKGYLAITKDEANELAKKQGLLINSMGVFSGEEE